MGRSGRLVGGCGARDKGTLEDVYEPYLIQAGFLERTGRGRRATRLAFDHFQKQKDLLPFSTALIPSQLANPHTILAMPLQTPVDAPLLPRRMSGPDFIAALPSRRHAPREGIPVMSEDLQSHQEIDRIDDQDFAPAEQALEIGDRDRPIKEVERCRRICIRRPEKRRF